jgi:hypothetical protein
MSPAVLSTDVASRVALAETLAVAQRDVVLLQRRLETATELVIAPTDRCALVASLRDELKAAEARHAEATRAVAEANRVAREASAKARDESREHVIDQARAVVATMLPYVERISALNDQLEALRKRLGNTGEVPVGGFRPHLLTTKRWLRAAQRFVGDGKR